MKKKLSLLVVAIVLITCTACILMACEADSSYYSDGRTYIKVSVSQNTIDNNNIKTIDDLLWYFVQNDDISDYEASDGIINRINNMTSIDGFRIYTSEEVSEDVYAIAGDNYCYLGVNYEEIQVKASVTYVISK